MRQLYIRSVQINEKANSPQAIGNANICICVKSQIYSGFFGQNAESLSSCQKLFLIGTARSYLAVTLSHVDSQRGGE